MQTDEEDCHRVEGYADKQRATNGVAIGSDRGQGEVERHDDRGLGQDQVDAERCPERAVDVAGNGLYKRDDLKPEGRPVQNARLIRVQSGALGVKRTLPRVDVQGMRVTDRDDECDSYKPGHPEHDREI